MRQADINDMQKKEEGEDDDTTPTRTDSVCFLIEKMKKKMDGHTKSQRYILRIKGRNGMEWLWVSWAHFFFQLVTPGHTWKYLLVFFGANSDHKIKGSKRFREEKNTQKQHLFCWTASKKKKEIWDFFFWRRRVKKFFFSFFLVGNGSQRRQKWSGEEFKLPLSIKELFRGKRNWLLI